MTLKLDIKKAFDKLEWSFIYKALTLFKYSPNITMLIMNCVSTNMIAVLVNGSRTEFFTRRSYISEPVYPLQGTLLHPS